MALISASLFAVIACQYSALNKYRYIGVARDGESAQREVS